jgi:hypothetical protein
MGCTIHKTGSLYFLTNSPVVVHGCERKEHRLQVLENKVFRKISGPKKDEESTHFRIL